MSITLYDQSSYYNGSGASASFSVYVPTGTAAFKKVIAIVGTWNKSSYPNSPTVTLDGSSVSAASSSTNSNIYNGWYSRADIFAWTAYSSGNKTLSATGSNATDLYIHAYVVYDVSYWCSPHGDQKTGSSSNVYDSYSATNSNVAFFGIGISQETTSVSGYSGSSIDGIAHNAESLDPAMCFGHKTGLGGTNYYGAVQTQPVSSYTYNMASYVLEEVIPEPEPDLLDPPLFTLMGNM